MSKASTVITASVITGVVLGSAIGAIVKATTAKKKKPKNLMKKSAELALEAMGGVLHGITHTG